MTDFQATYTACPTCKDAPSLQTRGVGQDDNRWLLRCDSCGTMYWYPKRKPPAMTVAEMNRRHEQKKQRRPVRPCSQHETARPGEPAPPKLP